VGAILKVRFDDNLPDVVIGHASAVVASSDTATAAPKPTDCIKAEAWDSFYTRLTGQCRAAGRSLALRVSPRDRIRPRSKIGASSVMAERGLIERPADQVGSQQGPGGLLAIHAGNLAAAQLHCRKCSSSA